jgi:hypothetical protein
MNAALGKAFFERSRFSFGDFAPDLLVQPFTRAARSKVSFDFFIPRRFFHPLKPACKLPPFLFCQMRDRFFDGFERHTVKLT